MKMEDSLSRDFESAGESVLAYLQEKLGFDLWVVTRKQGDDWIVLQSLDRGYDVSPGRVFRWADTFCSRMIGADEPQIAPDSTKVTAYAEAPICREIPIGAYAGVPLVLEDGTLFGTLCAVHPTPVEPAVTEEIGLLKLLGKLMSSILQAELKAAEEAQRSEEVEAEALTDPLTRLYNRRGWDRVIAREEARCRRYGHPAAVLIADLDHLKEVNDAHGHAAGDELLRCTGDALVRAARASDVVARLGGDEFGILSIQCDRAGAEALLERVRENLSAAGVAASVGAARRDPSRGLEAACILADERMYDDKRQGSTDTD